MEIKLDLYKIFLILIALVIISLLIISLLKLRLDIIKEDNFCREKLGLKAFVGNSPKDGLINCCVFNIVHEEEEGYIYKRYCKGFIN